MGVLFNNNKIKNIIIRNIKSYDSSGIEFKPNKFNIIYGLNGTGKTTISQFLNKPEKPEYSKCKLDVNKESDILVYNEDYINKVFREESLQKGIFTIGTENTEASDTIKSAKDELKNINYPIKKDDDTETTYLEQETNNIERLEKNFSNLSETLTANLWKYKTIYAKTPLHKLLTGANTKITFCQKIQEAKYIENDNLNIDEELTNLEEKIKQISNQDTKEKSFLNTIDNLQFSNLEQKTIWQESIVGSKDSYISDIIESLNNESWIQEGVTNYIDNYESCPFCNQHLDEDIKDKIKTHFNKAYQDKLNEIKTLQTTYTDIEQGIIALLSTNETNSNTLATNKDYSLKKEALFKAINDNKLLIESKLKNPSEKITLTEVQSYIDDVNIYVELENKQIRKFNTELTNVGQTIAKSKSYFFDLLKTKEKQNLEQFEKDQSLYKETKEVAFKALEALKAKIKVLEDIISDAKKETKNVDSSIEWINEQLNWMGINGFFIEKHSDSETLPLYRLSRECESSESIFQTLSEGEKTIISFLYFVQTTLGEINNKKDLDKRIIVIDDPISSLSFNYIFEVATLIYINYLQNSSKFSQVFILTHNLYFMHELLTQTRGDKNFNRNLSLLRVMKDNHSTIKSMERDEIQNDYQSYWKIIKDYKKSKSNGAIIPNTMRNILDHYFAFTIPSKTLSTTLNELAENNHEIEFKSFKRYINKESHSDNINLSDTKDLDIDKFLTYFENIFKEIGAEEHFNVMTGE